MIRSSMVKTFQLIGISVSESVCPVDSCLAQYQHREETAEVKFHSCLAVYLNISPKVLRFLLFVVMRWKLLPCPIEPEWEF